MTRMRDSPGYKQSSRRAERDRSAAEYEEPQERETISNMRHTLASPIEPNIQIRSGAKNKLLSSVSTDVMLANLSLIFINLIIPVLISSSDLSVGLLSTTSCDYLKRAHLADQPSATSAVVSLL